MPDSKRPLIDGRIGAVLAVCLVLVLGGQAVEIAQNGRVADEASRTAQTGVEAHIGLCGLKSYFDQQVADSQKFLKLTQDERTRLYGPIGNVPDSVIRAGLVKQEAAASKLDVVRCP